MPELEESPDSRYETIKQDTESIETNYSPPTDKEARWFFDYERLIWEIKAHLYGGWLTEDKKGYFVIKRVKGAVPFMNDYGIESTIALIQGFVTKIQGTSIADEERILRLCKEINFKLSVYYYRNMETFNVEPEKASVVTRMIMDAIEANWRKSLGGTSLKLIGTSERIIEQRQPQRQKLLGII